MKKYLFGIFAAIVAIGAVAFTTSPAAKTPGTYYFKFIGTANSQEDDRTKWEEITQAQYDNLVTCVGSFRGCKLIANDIEAIGTPAVNRPKEVYVISSTKNPTTGTYVDAVQNKQNSQ